MMEAKSKATRISLLTISTPQMRAFHMTWIAFFLCFFAWFGIAPLMSVVREEMQLTKEQIGWCIIGSVAITIVARLLIGWLCDRYGPRLTYTWLLLLGSLPVMGIGLAHDFTTFLLFRVLIGAIGASFVITQYHTSLMFAPNCVGTANATAAGWGNLGGGVTQLAMPLLFALFVGTLGRFGCRGLAAVDGRCRRAVCDRRRRLLLSHARHAGRQLPRTSRGRQVVDTIKSRRRFLEACRDRRVWALFVIYGCCFGMEITIDNIAVLYFLDYFDYFKQLDPGQALQMAGIAGVVLRPNESVRPGAGRLARRQVRQSLGTLDGRVKWLFVALFCEGMALMIFSQATTLDACHPAADHVRDVRQDVQRCHVCRRAVHQSAGTGRGERHRRRRRQRRRRARRLLVQERGDSIGTRRCSFWVPW